MLNHLAVGRGRFRAYSPGSQPRGEINPLALDLLREQKMSTEGLRSKSWNEFAGPDAPALDFVFTVWRKAFRDALFALRRRIELFANLPFDNLARLALQERVHEIGGE